MKYLALVSLALISTSAFAKHHVYKGWVSDQMCGVKGASAAHQACAAKCIKGGSPYIFILDKDKKTIYTVDNPTALKGHEGHLVQISGDLKGTSLHVVGVKMLKQPAAPKQKGDM